jgi:hypothetical protein
LLSKKNILLLFVGLIAFISAYIHFLSFPSLSFLYSDYGTFYQSSHFILQNKNPYTPIKATILFPGEKKPLSGKVPANLNPPLFSILILPLALFNYIASWWLWAFLSFTGSIISILLIQKALNLQKRLLSTFICLFFALFAYFPTFACMQLGQVTLILSPWLIGGWYAERQNKSALAGILLGFAASIKIFLGLFGLYFLIARKWKSLLFFSTTVLICGFIPVLFFGPHIYIDYYQIFDKIYWYTTNWNASLLGFLMRLFGGNEKNTPLISAPYLTHGLYWLFSAILLGGLIKFILDKSSKNVITVKEIWDLNYSAIIITSLLISPLGWNYYFPWLLLPFLLLFRLTNQGKCPVVVQVIAILAFVFSSMPFSMQSASKMLSASTVLLNSGFYFYALLLLLGLLYFIRFYCLPFNNQHQTLESSLAIVFYIAMFAPSLLGIIHSIYFVSLNPHAYMPVVLHVSFAG